MSDQGVAALVGLAVVIVLRLLDYFFPKGYVNRRFLEHSIKVEEDDDDEERHRKHHHVTPKPTSEDAEEMD